MKIRAVRKATDSKECLPTCGCHPPTAAEAGKPPCCGPPATVRGGEITERVPGFCGWLETAAGRVPQVATGLTWRDRCGSWKVRWGIGRMSYIVPPGLYAVGTPAEDDPVVVTANYKMSYDLVRRALAGRSIWLLVLETFGVNVWCAAGKGTFGTDELVRRIKESRLGSVVRHRRLLLPILGAPGVAAHEVRRRSGFTVDYAAIRAADLPAYLDNGLTTTPAMRELTFSLRERLVLVPLELVSAMKIALCISLLLFSLVAVLREVPDGITAVTAYLGAVFAGVALAPLLLPWLPGASFAVKGALTGLAWGAGCFLLGGGAGWHYTTTIAMFLALPAVSAFYALNFTGCTTYTSRTGVKKEMGLAMPAMGGALLASALLLIAGLVLQ